MLLDLPADEAARRIPATLAELVEDPERDAPADARRTRSTGWRPCSPGLGCGFTIRSPDELRASVRALGAQLAALA